LKWNNVKQQLKCK